MTSLTALSLQMQNASFLEAGFPVGLQQAKAASEGEGPSTARANGSAAAGHSGPVCRSGCLALAKEPELGPNGIERIILAANRAYRASNSPEQLLGAQINCG